MTTHVKSSSPLPCFRSSTTSAVSGDHRSAAAAHNLSTSVYKTSNGLFALTWCRNLLRRSFHLYILLDADAGDLSSSSSPSFSLNLKPFIFWNRTGSRKLNLNLNLPNSSSKSKWVQIFWDFSKVKFGLQPEPDSGFYIAVVVDGSMVLLAGDSPAEAFSKTKSTKSIKSQSVVLRREHFNGNKLYKTKAQFGNRIREISVLCRTGDDSRLYFSVDDKRVLQIKHLKWKFRGNERIEIDGVYVQISWDVYNWLFEEDNEDGYGLFMFS
ncbi:uncharacterized protein LOC124943032 [Impatiens glandulifera]|uniref:uncharacterized protein LOC124943032 n=1 Tax=Impatiens glandulifera TaxID=253017 RepID=UPI001FB102C4|nr:uncharacterized protein LOC124943032 [Impatiens glandulifera]